MKDCLFKFAIMGCTNCLPTVEFKEIMEGNNTHIPYPICTDGDIRHNQSLKYVLNKCKARRTKITARHNSIASKIIEEHEKVHHGKYYILENTPIPNEWVNLPSNLARLLPDVQIWNQSHDAVDIWEISVPYGCESHGVSRHEEAYANKSRKYRELVDKVQIRGIKVTFIISSHGVWDQSPLKQWENFFPTGRVLI